MPPCVSGPPIFSIFFQICRELKFQDKTEDWVPTKVITDDDAIRDASEGAHSFSLQSSGLDHPAAAAVLIKRVVAVVPGCCR